ncbi:MAG: hypothetical protein A2Z21_01760 [Candidatus Fraserbacteria bacterium RBG_16_55_9]|uniref:DUF3800 domain-containing protein n=1 Tax=Fraserbacteria sp. (strain RBG_16_55_9) TaxID=1817864 RepID=A0A1F5V0Q2_FRAXR|nr:MAG: hypothetical protein A2Z21_01760 [Candidatus Fraserbacteria bacterium RBG_16_55_9]
MRFIYLDESRDEKLLVLSALAVSTDGDLWNLTLDEVIKFRRELKKNEGIYLSVELHAWKFVSGRGRIADRVIPKGRRCAIFGKTLEFMTTLPEAKLFNVALPIEQSEWAFERLINRINTALKKWNTYGILICDEGNEGAYTKTIRRLRKHNPATKNIPVHRILEDPFFKKSQQSYFLQLVDFAAYALLRRERPLASKSKYGLDKAFNRLKPILALEANLKDPDGVIR